MRIGRIIPIITSLLLYALELLSLFSCFNHYIKIIITTERPKYKVSNFLLVLLFLCGFNASFATVTDTIKLDVSKHIVTPKHYIVSKTNTVCIIDGLANEKAWEAVPFSDSFIDIEGIKKPKFDTRFKMMWSDNYLYVFAQLQEPHIWGDLTQRDTVIFYNNDFEIFIDPSGDGTKYGEIEINALNTVWDLFLNKPYRVGGSANNFWNLPALETAVHINGTLNQATDSDTDWSVEMAIPMAALIELKNKPKSLPKEGEQWRMNFSRVQWDHDIVNGKYERKKVTGKYLREYNWVWSNQTRINMHAPEKWGYVQFTHQNNTSKTAFIPVVDEKVKQVAYELFMSGKYSALAKHEHNIYSGQAIQVEYGGDTPLNATYIKTQIGFEINLTSPETGKTYLINQEGVLREAKLPTPIEKPFVFATWAHGSNELDVAEWNEKLAEYQRLGISEVLVGGSPEFLTELVPLANNYAIKIHAWMWTLNRPNDTTANQHPEWYAVNRAGKNSLEYRAYVDYYQWLSPFHPEAREYIKDNVRKLTEVEGLASIHLDYVRYVDVILGADLQPKYNLVQDHEMPEYDYGYHPIAREGFKEIFGYDPQDLEHPELSTEWRQYRLNAITTLVNEIVEIAHQKNHKITAAVFPFPEMSRQMVRQAWNDWNLDAAYPMLYQNFYQESVNWIGFATKQGVNAVDFPIYAGLYSPGLKDAADLEKAIRLAKENGASGFSIFTADGLSDEQKAVLIKLKTETLD
ncbi:MAG: family 10 glycosylhydrolase [Crocinitomix sp.]|nr:family 10 glycosylhydrolase [Crocinitomix sp.]